MSNRGLPPGKPFPASYSTIPKVPAAVRIAGIYLIVGLLWIFFSDYWLSALLGHHIDAMTSLQTLKGGVYVIVTAGMLWWLINREIQVSQRASRKLKTALTELQSTEAALQKTQEQFLAFMDYSPAASWITNVEGRLEYVSQSYNRMFQAPSDLIGQSIFDIYPETIARTYLKNIQAVAHSGQVLEVIEPGIRGDGSLGEFLVYKFPLPQPEGHQCVGGVAIDITQWKQVETELKASEEQLRLALDFTQIGTWDWNLTTNHIVWNKNHFDLLGVDPETTAASYTAWRDRIHPDDLARTEAAITAALETHTAYDAEYRVVHPDASVHWLHGKGRAIYNEFGEPTRMLGALYEITERKGLERALRRQAEQLELTSAIAQRIRRSLNLKDILNTTVVEVKQLLQVDRVIVYQFAPDFSGTIVAESVSAGWQSLLGMEVTDTYFQTEDAYHYVKKRAVANIYTAGLAECHRQLLERFDVKAKLIAPILLMEASEGTPALWGALIVHQCSAPREWHGEQLDLLEQIALQLAIAIQQAQIYEKAQIELMERQQAEKHLRAALADKEVLLKEIHHRVKNNLQIVSGLLQLQAQGLSDPQVVDALKESQSRVESMSLIHKKLYRSSDLEQIDVADYIQSLAVGLLATYQIAPGAVTLQVDVDPVVLNLDQAIPCGLIINELVSNALKYAFAGRSAGTITIKLCQVDHQLELTIQDDGIGLPEDLNWQDLDWQNTQSLGLSLVHALATDQLDGTLAVNQNCGTTFTIKFPPSSQKA